MIYDHINHIATYASLSPDILAGLEFIRQAKPDTPCGVHQINPRVKAIVSEYRTQARNPNGYEAHRRYIDIQCTLVGRERVACLPIEQLTEQTPYSPDADAALYSPDAHHPQEMTIGQGYFAIFFPQDGHMPQLAADQPEDVRKVVVKVQID